MTRPATYTAAHTHGATPIKKSHHGYHPAGIHVRLPRMKADDSWVLALRATPPSTGAAHPASHRSSGGIVPLAVVVLAVLIAVLTQLMPSRLRLRRRRLAGAPVAGLSGDRVHSFGGRDALRGNGDRLRVAFDRMGSEVLIVSVAVACAVALGALIAG
ncbi:MAG: hypothetical protein ACTHQQ_06425 [Solirubrobacteraceae bacterium]